MDTGNYMANQMSDLIESSGRVEKKMTIYKHYKKGGNYIIINAGAMQIDDVWKECVIYQCLDSKKIYVRETIDFDLKFSAEEEASIEKIISYLMK